MLIVAAVAALQLAAGAPPGPPPACLPDGAHGADGVARAAAPPAGPGGSTSKNALTAADVGPSWWKK